MTDLRLPSDAFSHGQIRSKTWLTEKLEVWLKPYKTEDRNFSLFWYGSWVGVGPLLMLLKSPLHIGCVNLFDLNAEQLVVAEYLLNYWKCEGVNINSFRIDVNNYHPEQQKNQIFINTACEHMDSSDWLKNIPSGSLLVLQSTNMPHHEHTSCHSDLAVFLVAYSDWVNVLESEAIHFNYPDKSFSRFMLFGIKK